MQQLIAFIGGGNMASAIVGGLVRNGRAPRSIVVIDPGDLARERMASTYGVQVSPEVAGAGLEDAYMAVWAVKPQSFKEAAQACQGRAASALHLSVMAGIPSSAIAQATGSTRVVRAMPNTPALIGKGITGLYARPEVDQQSRDFVESVLASTGSLTWVDREALLDAVTALSGSGPAYVFYFVEAMIQAGTEMGLTADQARQLALATFSGASELASQASEDVSALRERVTSKGGTTYAALTSLESAQVGTSFVRALHAACDRARELGEEFGR